MYALLFLWAFVFAPFIFDMFMPTIAAQFSTIFKPVVAILIETFYDGVLSNLSNVSIKQCLQRDGSRV